MSYEIFADVAHVAFRGFIHQAPIFLLQAVALIGTVASFLVLRSKPVKLDVSSWELGAALGAANFLLYGLSDQWFTLPEKVYIFADVLFISSWFCGWRSGLVAFAFCLSGRLFFGNAEYTSFAVMDMAAITAGSLLLRRYTTGYGWSTLSAKTILQLVCLRFVAVELPVAALRFFDLVVIPDSFFAFLIVRRALVSFTFSALTVSSILFILKREYHFSRLLYVDPISGVSNRRVLQKYIEDSYIAARTGKQNTPQILLLIEVKNFQELIQAYTHDWADDFFRRIGQELEECKNREPWKRYTPQVFCFSENSFAVVMHGLTAKTLRSNGLAHILYNELSLLHTPGKYALQARISVGVISLLYKKNFTADKFLRALTLWDKQHRGTVYYIEPTITQQLQFENNVRLKLEQTITEGIAPLWLQPKINLRTGQCVGGEALLRLQESNNYSRYAGPPFVLSVAEKYHLSDKLEQCIVGQAIEYIASLPKELQHIQISANLSPSSLAAPGFGETLCEILERKGIEGNRLIIEIIETSRLALSKTVEENIKHMNRYGVWLSLDDFGTGYSSIYLLSRLPVNELKLDYSMISCMDNPRVLEAIIMALEGAKRYETIVVAEGIENIWQSQQLLRLGVDIGQGYLFSKAVPYDAFVRYALTRETKFDSSELNGNGQLPLLGRLDDSTEDVLSLSVNN